MLVAMLVAVSALGGMLAALAADPDGPMSLFSFLSATPGPDPHALAICSNSALAAACRGLREQQLYAQWPGMLVRAAPALLLLLAADGLRRGRRLAWWLVVGINLTVLGASIRAACAAGPGAPPAAPAGEGGGPGPVDGPRETASSRPITTTAAAPSRQASLRQAARPDSRDRSVSTPSPARTAPAMLARNNERADTRIVPTPGTAAARSRPGPAGPARGRSWRQAVRGRSSWPGGIRRVAGRRW